MSLNKQEGEGSTSSMLREDLLNDFKNRVKFRLGRVAKRKKLETISKSAECFKIMTAMLNEFEHLEPSRMRKVRLSLLLVRKQVQRELSKIKTIEQLSELTEAPVRADCDEYCPQSGCRHVFGNVPSAQVCIIECHKLGSPCCGQCSSTIPECQDFCTVCMSSCKKSKKS